MPTLNSGHANARFAKIVTVNVFDSFACELKREKQ